MYLLVFVLYQLIVHFPTTKLKRSVGWVSYPVSADLKQICIRILLKNMIKFIEKPEVNSYIFIQSVCVFSVNFLAFIYFLLVYVSKLPGPNLEASLLLQFHFPYPLDFRLEETKTNNNCKWAASSAMIGQLFSMNLA